MASTGRFPTALHNHHLLHTWRTLELYSGATGETFSRAKLQLVAVADDTVVHLEYIETMVAIYLKVASKQDRLAIWPIITDQMDTARKRLDLKVDMTNLCISQLTTPGVVAEAMRMRDDLRRVEEDLEGARKELEAAEAKLP